MASCVPFDHDQPFSQCVKSMADDELLEVWEESQHLEHALRRALQADVILTPDLEKTIVEELFLRVGRRLGASAVPK